MPNQSNSKNKAQIVYLSHGGGPLPILGNESHIKMVDFMRQLPASLEKPEAILVISAHWEEEIATLTGASTPPMFYDYYGFPDEAYQLKYPAPGSPELANRIAGLYWNTFCSFCRKTFVEESTMVVIVLKCRPCFVYG